MSENLILFCKCTGCIHRRSNHTPQNVALRFFRLHCLGFFSPDADVLHNKVQNLEPKQEALLGSPMLKYGGLLGEKKHLTFKHRQSYFAWWFPSIASIAQMTMRGAAGRHWTKKYVMMKIPHVWQRNEGRRSSNTTNPTCTPATPDLLMRPEYKWSAEGRCAGVASSNSTGDPFQGELSALELLMLADESPFDGKLQGGASKHFRCWARAHNGRAVVTAVAWRCFGLKGPFFFFSS